MILNWIARDSQAEYRLFYIVLGQYFDFVASIASFRVKPLYFMEVVWQVHLGQYFVDIRSNNLPQSYRAQWSRKGLANSFNEALTTLPKPTQVHFEFESFDRLFTSRLGGSVAQFYFHNLKDELFFSQPCRFKTPRRETLGSPDLTLSWSEALKNPEQTLSKLAEKSVKRIVILEPLTSNEELLLLESLKEKYQVFVSPSSNLSDKRSTLLQACLQGGLLEIEESLLPFKTANEGVAFWFKNSNRELLPKPETTLSHWNSCFKPDAKVPTLYFGFETWGILAPILTNSEISTPWGHVLIKQNPIKEFSLQPTQEWKGFDPLEVLSGDELGYDPGPMCFGRGLKPQIADFFLSLPLNSNLEIPEVQESGRTKFKHFMEAISRQATFEAQSKITIEKMVSDLAQEIAFETLVCMKDSKSYQVSGPLSPYVMKYLESALNSLNLKRELTS